MFKEQSYNQLGLKSLHPPFWFKKFCLFKKFLINIILVRYIPYTTNNANKINLLDGKQNFFENYSSPSSIIKQNDQGPALQNLNELLQNYGKHPQSLMIISKFYLHMQKLKVQTKFKLLTRAKIYKLFSKFAQSFISLSL